MNKHKNNQCKNKVPCHCLVPEWGPFFVCCGYECTKCKGSLNRHKPPARKEREVR